MPRTRRRPTRRADWDDVADWYDRWVGSKGGEHHRRYAIPALIDLLRPGPGERILDLGCGQGVLAPAVAATRAEYTGVDSGERLLRHARRRHGQQGRFLVGDTRRLSAIDPLRPHSFDGVTFLLSIQNIDPLESALHSASWALKPGGRAVLLMTHPCFRLPRQSGWGWDKRRRLKYRRIDRYKTPYCFPCGVRTDSEQGTTRNFHRPLESYINGLAAAGLLVDRIREVAIGPLALDDVRDRAALRAYREIPLFLGLRARKASRLVQD